MNISYQRISPFRKKLLTWYEKNSRSFPWRYTSDPYLVLISEVLLQQTNVEKVLEPYYFITKKYPTISQLAKADRKILAELFAPLGLFYRADRLVDIAKSIEKDFIGTIPNSEKQLLSIKGIGRYATNAILCFGFNKRAPIVDTNIIRIYNRFFGIESVKKRPRTDNELWVFSERVLPKHDYIDFNYALLDFGSIKCKYYNPCCSDCVLRSTCLLQKR